MSGIESPYVHVETYRSSDGHSALMQLRKAVNGCGMAFQMVNTGEASGAFYLCLRADDPRNAYIVAVPSTKWKGDVKDDGFTIVQRINFDQLIATAAFHESQKDRS